MASSAGYTGSLGKGQS